MHDTADSHGAASGDESAETLAQSLIGKVDASGLLRLLRLLPSEAPARGSRTKGQGSEFSFTTGAYTYDHGAKLGLRQNCRLFPCVTRVLCEYVSTRAPEARYTTLALFRDLQSKVHADLGNDPQQCNNIFRLSNFQDGGLWLECDDGDQPCPLQDERRRKGRVVDFQQDRISFDAQVPHCVMPWHGGSRVVLVAFTVKNHDRITAQDVNDLQGLGFQLPARGVPTTSGGDCVRVGVSKRPPQSSGCHSPSLASPLVVLTPNARVLSPLSSDPTAGPGSVTTVKGPDDGTSGVMRTQAGLCKPSFVELFCGSAGLSAEMLQLGFQVLGVDNKPTAKQARAPVINLDLRDPEQQDRLWPEIRRAHVVWLAPPCGTSSAARRIPLHGRHKGPRPLRSRAHPDGVPDLTSTDAARVASANALYDFASKVFSFCLKQGTLCIVENPASSLMWQTSWFRDLLRQSQVYWHEFHSCMYGSARRKRTGLLSTTRLPGLMRRCDASHSHKAWGRTRTVDGWTFATAEEAAYPQALCRAAARDISLALREQGICLDEIHSTDNAASATNAQKQPRRGRGTVGPPEYKQSVLVRLPVACIPPDFAPKEPPAFLAGILPGSKLLWTRVLLDGGIEVREAEYGVYHTPQEFLQEATKVTHPFDSAVTIDGPNLRAIAFTLEHGVKAVSQKRRALLEHYRAIERSLRDQEFALKESMDPAVRRVMGSKRLLLFKQMLADAGVPDENLFNDMVNGFRLTGPLEPSGLSPLSISLQ